MQNIQLAPQNTETQVLFAEKLDFTMMVAPSSYRAYFTYD